ncbi:MAG: putative bifunctional diguanylate cyclase/phosphodiesterase [Thermoleophilaceae bacterium]
MQWNDGGDRQLWEALLAALSELGEGVAVVDIETQRYLFVNDALCRMYGYSAEEMLALPSFFSILPPDEVAELEPERARRAAGAPMEVDRYETRVIRKDGRLIDIELSVKPLPMLAGSRMVALVHDITQEHAHAREAVAAEQKYRQLVERLPVVTYVAQPGEVGDWIYVSPQIERMLGYTPEEWMADPTLWARCVHPDDRDRVFAAEARLELGEHVPPAEYRMFSRTGELIWVRDDAVLRPEPADGRWLLDGLLTDITAGKVAESRLQHLADHDALTGLLNRRRFIEELTLELALIRREQRKSSVLVVDVDNFKYVNDSLGHHAGDQLIRSVANVLAAELRAADTIARLGGDEFAILLRAATGAPALVVAQRLIEAVRTHAFAIAPEPVRVTASGGMAAVGGDGDQTAEETLAAADLAMYESKRTGRDRLVEFSPTLRVALEQRRTWADRIRRALEEDLLVLFQQPILDLATGQVSQHELLVRMEADDGTIVTPDEFLPVAERFDLVQAIDRWVVRRAIQLIADAEQAGRDLVLEVNLSGRSMGDADLFELLERELRDSGIDASKLVLEVTETAAIENMEDARTFAQRLASLGCRLALDDFGSGFGSFYYLKHLPLDYLKIDGDFVRNLCRNPVDQAVVRSIVQIAESVGYETIAEFVLDDETLDAVRDYGVHFAQGYHIGMPEPIASLQVS